MNKKITKAEPTNPCSSPMVQKMKSVSCSGTYFNLVCVPLRKPFPNNPPEPMAILLWLTLYPAPAGHLSFPITLRFESSGEVQVPD